MELETVRRLEGLLASLGSPWDTEKWAWLRTLKAELTDFAGELGMRKIRDGSKALASRTERIQKPFTEMQTIRNGFFWCLLVYSAWGARLGGEMWVQFWTQT